MRAVDHQRKTSSRIISGVSRLRFREESKAAMAHTSTNMNGPLQKGVTFGKRAYDLQALHTDECEIRIANALPQLLLPREY